MTITLYSEAKDEADRLSRMLKRDVEVAAVNCDCDYSKGCYACAGSGRYFELRFGFCNHVVQDSNNDECDEADCVHLEYLAFCKREELEAVA
jgi:hypothetical protein